MISQSVEYALRAIVTLGYRHDEPMTGQQIAEITRVPAPYLLKLMQQLVRAGLIHSQRGRGGGFSLTRPPAEITMWDIIEAVDPLRRIESCPLGFEGHTTLCPLHRRLDNATAEAEAAFRNTTVQEMLIECGESSPLCTSTPVMQIQGIKSPGKAAQSSSKPKP